MIIIDAKIMRQNVAAASDDRMLCVALCPISRGIPKALLLCPFTIPLRYLRNLWFFNFGFGINSMSLPWLSSLPRVRACAYSARAMVLRTSESKVLSRPAMVAERARLKRDGRVLVFTNGAFDILHAGHVTYLQFARRQGDALVVGLNSDASVKRYKGDKRPVNPQSDRALVLAALECVDYVVVFDEDEPKELIGELIPDVLVKGADWAHYVSGRDIVEAHGGKVVLADMVAGRSTTNVIGKVVEVYGGTNPPSPSSSPSPSNPPSRGTTTDKQDAVQ